jgi:NAD(P)-dependent dehydrogenase (short-subunit alcohol dehydrogenase family)
MTKRTAIIVGVGAERGFGAALYRRFAREGYHVLIVGRVPERIGSVAAANLQPEECIL